MQKQTDKGWDCKCLNQPLGMPEPPFPQDEEVSPSNPFLEEEEVSRRDARPLERALDMLMVTTSRRCSRKSETCNTTQLYKFFTKCFCPHLTFILFVHV